MNTHKKMFSLKKSINVVVFLLLGACIALKNDAYSFEPFIVPLLSFSVLYGLESYIASNISLLVVSFLISIPYGYEMMIIEAIFLVTKVASNLFLSEHRIRLYFPYIITSLLLFTIYYAREPTLTNFLNLSFLLILSFLAFYSFHKALDKIQHTTNEWGAKERLLTFTLFPFLFNGLTSFFFMIMRFVELFLMKTAKMIEVLCSSILSAFLLYFVFNVSEVIIFSLLFPLLCAYFFAPKYRLYAYFVSFLFCEAFLYDAFYLESSFYQGIVAIIIAFMIPKKSEEKICVLFDDVQYQDDKRTRKVIQNITSYLDVVLDPTLEDSLTPLENVVSQFEADLCYHCEKKESCHLENIRRKGVEDKLNSEERKIVLGHCLYPYRFFKRALLMNGIYEKEDKKIKETLFQQDLYKKELKNIYTPLKLLESPPEIMNQDEIKETLINEGYEVLDVRIYDTSLDVRFLRADEHILLDAIPLIEKRLHRSLWMKKSAYSFSSGCYLANYTWERQYEVDLAIFESSVFQESGDHYSYEESEGKFFLLLSDGMGHNKTARDLSTYLIDSLKAYRKMDENFVHQIDTVNRLLYHKSTSEAYATLDYFLLDLVTLKFTLFKAGSFPTFIYRDGILKESKRNFPPLGILQEIDVFAYEDHLQEQDILIFLSDGFGSDISEILEDTLKEKGKEDAKTLKDSLVLKLLNNVKVVDDQTLIVIKINSLKNDEEYN